MIGNLEISVIAGAAAFQLIVENPPHERRSSLAVMTRAGGSSSAGSRPAYGGGRDHPDDSRQAPSQPPMTGKRVLEFLVARPLIAVSIAAVVVGVMFVLQTHRQTTPVTHRTEHVRLSDAEQAKLGNEQYTKTLQQDRAQIVSSGAAYAHVQRVAKRIEAVAGRDKPSFDWRVTLLRKNEANAYCLPGGKIVVYTGILPITRSDDALATVLGHEVAHATAEHAAERIEREHLTRVAAAIVAGGVAFTPKQYLRVVALLGVAGSLRFSRKQESEADHIGLVYMARAGYDPRGAVPFWKRMQRASRGKEPPEFVSDHPSDAHRIERIQQWMPEARRAYTPSPGT